MEQNENFLLLQSLEKVRWNIIRNTYGSSHCTLIGLLVDWWISGDAKSRYVLESGPAFGYRPRSQGGGGQCDAIFVQGNLSKGVLEVEGGYDGKGLERYTKTLKKIGQFFAAEYQDLKSLTFGIFLAYPTRKEHMVDLLPLDEFLKEGLNVSKQYPDKQLIILVLDKKWNPQQSGPRARGNLYYQADPYQFRGVLLENGRIISQNHFKI